MVCFRVAACVLVVFFALGSGARADDLPDALTLRAKSTAAYGAATPNGSETITSVNASFTTVRHSYHRGSDVLDVFDAGPIHTESGIIHGERWHQNDNGHTVIELPERAPPGAEPTTTTVTRVHTPIDAFVIATLTKNGSGSRDFIDAQTYFNVRRELLGPTGKIVTEYSDFRAFGTRHLAAHWVERNERTQLETTYERTDYREDNPGEASVRMPENKRRLVEFPPGTSSVDLPAQLTPEKHWIVRVMVGDRGLDFTLDTGASGITIDSDVARQLDLTLVNQLRSTVNAGSYKTGSAIVHEMHVGQLTMHDTVVHVAPLGFNERGDIKSVGLLGFDFLCESQFTLDYEHRRISVVPFESATEPTDPKTFVLDVRLNSQQPAVTTTINGVRADRMIFDTGGAGSMLFFDSFVRRHPDALAEADRLPGLRRFQGVGGVFETEPYVVPHLLLGRVDFTKFTAYRVRSAATYATTEDGILGPDFFRLFTVGLDYAHGRIFLTPNGDFHPER